MAFPNIPFSNITLNSNTPTVVTKSLSGREQRTQVAGQYFTIVGNFSNLSESDRKTLLGFMASVKGNYTTFTITLPSPLGTSSAGYSGTITSVTASAGATTFSGTVGTSGAAIFKAGDLIKFSSHDKVYMVTADATAVGTTVTASIYPALRSALSSATVTHTSVPITVRLNSDIHGFSMDPTFYANFDLEFVEVL